ncbi:MAG: hypothetical protein GXP25_13555 [Planctomycetes bacterium]|nr:hypothetical protein [Planctomycetota bacterium]
MSVSQLLDLVNPGTDAIERGRARQRECASPEGGNYLPILLQCDVPEIPPPPGPNKPALFGYDEQFADPEKMLAAQLRNAIMLCRTRSDAVPFVAPRFGIGFLPSVFGIEQEVFPDRPPWIKRHLSKEEAREATVPEDLSTAGLIPKAITFIRRAHELLEDRIAVGLYFMLSPIDIAFMVRGEDIMFDMHDDPAFVHELLEKTTDVFIKATKLLKAECGEPTDEGTYEGGLYMAPGGVMLCEDCAVMLSPDFHREFSIPYTRRALAEFGGGWVHFCGDGKHLMENYYRVEDLRGFLFGQLDLYDREKLLLDIVSHGKSLRYHLPRKKDEALPDYFDRALRPLAGRPRRGMIFGTYVANPEDAPAAMDAWHAAQDRLL